MCVQFKEARQVLSQIVRSQGGKLHFTARGDQVQWKRDRGWKVPATCLSQTQLTKGLEALRGEWMGSRGSVVQPPSQELEEAILGLRLGRCVTRMSATTRRLRGHRRECHLARSQ